MTVLNIALLDDTLDVLRSLPSMKALAGHDVTVYKDHVTDVGELGRRLADKDVLVLMRERTKVDAALIGRLPRLQMISQISDTPHIDVAACTDHGILISSNRFPGAPNFRTLHATAELTWALALAASRRLPSQMLALRQGRWQTEAGRSLRGRTLGVFGYGRIGKVVAGYGRAFGMQVQVWGSKDSLERARADGHSASVSKEAFFASSDVLSLHLRLNAQTRAIVDREDLARMKPESILVNTSRAGLIAPGALLEALRAGHPGQAAVDVFDEEPMTDTANPLLALDNFLCTPHIGYVEHDSLDDQYAEIYAQIKAWESGNPVNVINPEVLARNTGPRKLPAQS
mgnify:FL=1